MREKIKLYLLGILVLALGLTTAARTIQYSRSQRALLKERTQHAREVLRLNGLIEGQVTTTPTPPPSIKEVVKVIKESGSKVAATSQIVYQQVEVPIPCDTPTIAGEGEGDDKHAHTMSIAATNDLLLALDPAGKPWLKSKLFLDLTSPTFLSPIHVELSPDATKTRLDLSKEVQDAFNYYNDRPSRIALVPRPIKHWRIGPVIGLGIAIDPIQSHAGAAVFAGYGVQF